MRFPDPHTDAVAVAQLELQAGPSLEPCEETQGNRDPFVAATATGQRSTADVGEEWLGGGSSILKFFAASMHLEVWARNPTIMWARHDMGPRDGSRPLDFSSEATRCRLVWP